MKKSYIVLLPSLLLCLDKPYMTLDHKPETVCLAIPGKILEIDKKTQHALVDYGDGTKRRANISLVDVKVGDYVIVHAGFAIQILDKQEAQETLALFREMLSHDEGS